MNDDLVLIDAFKSLIEIQGDFIIRSNHKIEKLDACNKLESIGNSLIVEDNFLLNSVLGYKQLDSIGKYCQFFGNSNLMSINGLGSLKSSFSLEVVNNPNVRYLGFSSLEMLEVFRFQSNTESTKVFGLNNIQEIKEIYISSNSSLKSLELLANLGFANVVHVVDNIELTSLKELGGVKGINELLIDGNNSIKNLTGLNHIINLNNLKIANNENLTNIIDLENLQSVNNPIYILNNPNINSLAGLEHLNQSGGFHIRDNVTLRDFCALENYYSTQNSFISCTGNQFNPSTYNMQNGKCGEYYINIHSNSGGYIDGDTVQAIFSNQTTSPVFAYPHENYELANWVNQQGEIVFEDNPLLISNPRKDLNVYAEFNLLNNTNTSQSKILNVYPNPFNESLIITCSYKVIIEVIDPLGRIVFESPNESNSVHLNTADFQSGSYLLKIINGDNVTYHKVLKN